MEKHAPLFARCEPFELTPAEVAPLATKASALWSLRLNARDHEKVAEVCRIEAQRPGGPAGSVRPESPPDRWRQLADRDQREDEGHRIGATRRSHRG